MEGILASAPSSGSIARYRGRRDHDADKLEAGLHSEMQNSFLAFHKKTSKTHWKSSATVQVRSIALHNTHNTYIQNRLLLQQSLDLARAYLEKADNTKDSDVALILCLDTETTLSQAKKAARFSRNQITRNEIATLYDELGRVLERHGYHHRAQANFQRAAKWGMKMGQEKNHTDLPLDPQSNLQRVATLEDSTVDASYIEVPLQLPQEQLQLLQEQRREIVDVPAVFTKDTSPPIVISKLPGPDERLNNTTQLACCLGILKASHALDDVLKSSAREWLIATEDDQDEQERLKMLCTEVIRAYIKDEFKDAKTVAEVMCLVPVIEKDVFKDLLAAFHNGIDRSKLLDVDLLDGLARLVQGAEPDFLEPDDLVKILQLISSRLRNTHTQSKVYIRQLTLTASRLLDAMADTKVNDLDREKLHEPLSECLEKWKHSTDPFLVYQAAYAFQALQTIPDNESPWQEALRRTGKVFKGVSGIVSAAKALNVTDFIEGLENIQEGLDVAEVIEVARNAYVTIASVVGGGKDFMESIREGFSFRRRCAWYPMLRMADSLIRDGELESFKRLVCEAPCRLDLEFQWGLLATSWSN
ncbi:hypothetical protein B0O80DRAFT_425790 [Mortierella sp. GBAus27b]|nr:hypothetical protein B0O80DRAFT_425790 [Mortierella sp. GBAus27b]